MKHLLLLLAACSNPHAAESSQPVVLVPVAVREVGVETLDEPAFLKLLQVEDWSPVIDPARGVVSLTEFRNVDDGETHEITVHHWCLPRAALWVKFEALDLAAELTAQSSVLSRCHKLDARTEPTIAIDCVQEDGKLKSFRFARNGSRLVLVGVAALTVGEIAPNDSRRFDAAIANPGPCEP